MLGIREVRYKVANPMLTKLIRAGMTLLKFPIPAPVAVVAFPLVIKKEKWNDGTCSGPSYGVSSGYLYSAMVFGGEGPSQIEG